MISHDPDEEGGDHAHPSYRARVDPGWWVKLEGQTEYLRDLVEYFKAPELHVIEEGGAFYLGSDRFVGLAEPRCVRTEAVRLAAVATGSASLELGPFRAPRATVVVRVDEEGRQHPHPPPVTFLQRLRSAIHGQEERTRPDGSVELVEVVPARRTEDYARLALDRLALGDPRVEDALAILGREDLRWHDLYHVFELVEYAVGGEMFTRGWATKAEIDRFTQTANSRQALGREARHGKDVDAPSNPPNFDTARKLVVRLVERWLETMPPPRKTLEVPSANP